MHVHVEWLFYNIFKSFVFTFILIKKNYTKQFILKNKGRRSTIFEGRKKFDFKLEFDFHLIIYESKKFKNVDTLNNSI